MEEFSKVSLGFAEFVSLLLHETFDAVLSAQNYQSEKYSELEKALSISTLKFRELYLSDNEIKEKEVEIFGVPILENMSIPDDLLAVIKRIIRDFDQEKAIANGILTNDGVAILVQEVIEAIVAEKKGGIRQLVNKSEMVRLMVDSGEIRVKLELTNLYQSTDTESSQGDTAKKVAAPLFWKRLRNRAATMKQLSVKVTSVKGAGSEEVKILEILDPVSKQKILLIDKATLQKDVAVSSSMPNVRLIVTPAQVTSNSNLFSEVIIKFKTI